MEHQNNPADIDYLYSLVFTLCHMFPNKVLWNLCTARILFITNLSLFLNFFKSSFLNTQKCLFLLSPLNIENLHFSIFQLNDFWHLSIFKKIKSTFICVCHDQKPLSKMQWHYKFGIIKVVKKNGHFFSFMPFIRDTALRYLL